MACNDLPPLDFGVLYLGRTFDGCAWGVIDPVTGEPVDLTDASALCQWREEGTARTVGSPDTPALELSSADNELTFEDGTEDLDGLTFQEFMDAREPGDPLPMVGYPWIVSLEPLLLTGVPPSHYSADVMLDVLDDETDVRTIRELRFKVENPVSRAGG